MNQTIKTFAKHYVNKNEAAIQNMVDTIAKSGKLGKDAARAVFNLYKKEKAFNYDSVQGRYTVKHGALLEESTIEHALRIINGVC